MLKWVAPGCCSCWGCKTLTSGTSRLKHHLVHTGKNTELSNMHTSSLAVNSQCNKTLDLSNSQANPQNTFFVPTLSTSLFIYISIPIKISVVLKCKKHYMLQVVTMPKDMETFKVSKNSKTAQTLKIIL